MTQVNLFLDEKVRLIPTSYLTMIIFKTVSFRLDKPSTLSLPPSHSHNRRDTTNIVVQSGDEFQDKFFMLTLKDYQKYYKRKKIRISLNIHHYRESLLLYK